MALSVAYHEPRQGGENPQGVHFGFVYFNDGKRVGYTDQGVVADATGGTGPVGPDHVRLATEYLENQGNILGTRVEK